MKLHFELSGCDTASCGAYSVKAANAPICKLARKLVDNFFNPDSIVSIYRGETKCFEDITLAAWANLTVVESDRVSARFAKYSPLPEGAFK